MILSLVLLAETTALVKILLGIDKKLSYGWMIGETGWMRECGDECLSHMNIKTNFKIGVSITFICYMGIVKFIQIYIKA